jgi:hypothetical protein
MLKPKVAGSEKCTVQKGGNSRKIIDKINLADYHRKSLPYIQFV